MSDELSPTYSPAGLEVGIYAQWEAAGVFAPVASRESRVSSPRTRKSELATPFVTMMPPPNVTANLHMGHGLNNTLQDVLTRWARMRGRPALWLPGTDHAGIATQNVVERLLAKEGKTRFDLGRDPFVARVHDYVDVTKETILRQLRSIGSSADWGRTYYTFDEHYSTAVREVFVRLYEKGLIYRGKRIINWCPRCLTALSNEEAEKEEQDGKIWHLRYPLADGSGSLVVATTRPETMLGDSGVAVHPDDERYRALVGKVLALPLTDRTIPVVADAAVDPAFGSGAVKVTPAHDPTDFEIGQRHGLAQIDVMTPEARMAETVPQRFQGLDRYDARKKVVAEFDALGLLVKVEEHRHAVGHCYRCDTVVEPRLSDQWFVEMAPLAKPALDAFRTGKVTFVPERWGDTYTQWLEGIRDWCISRQLWWGHRIPVWYCDSCESRVASRTDITACPTCKGPVRQDEDVLDTWFSSWLVPFASLGWPDETADLARFYPGTVLITAPEILFFWVARMIMAGLEFRGEVPFSTVYLHGTVRDTQHRKMSKSLGNGIDPLDVIDRFGADALRYTVVSGMAVGTDLILDPKDLDVSFAAGRNFANKLWNAARFLLGNLKGAPRPVAGAYREVVRADELTLADRWIIARCDAAVRASADALEKFRLNDAASAAYHFLWSDFADWYVEAIKPRLYGDVPGGDVARAVAYRVFDTALRLLHPVMPFITEAVWQKLPGRAEGELLATARWPEGDVRAADPAALAQFALVQEVVTALRQIRAENGVEPGKQVEATVVAATAAMRAALELEGATVARLAKVSTLAVGKAPAGAAASAVLSDGSTVVVPLGGMVDLQKECAKLGQERDRLAGLVANQEKKLANEQFVARAPAAVIDGERKKLAEWSAQVAKLEERRKALGC
ncbi:MAG TPA: valine--tRNA ligase [Gemmatimonadales bacterium]|nr:valine--tRNA ligase [Gemmatimonadales bacterium]